MKTLAQQEVIRMKTVKKMAMVAIILTMMLMMMIMKISTSIATKIITLTLKRVGGIKVTHQIFRDLPFCGF